MDVTWNVAVKKVNNGALHAPIAIVNKSDDGKAVSHVYNTISDLSSDYDESTEVYKNAAAITTADGFNAPIQVIEYPDGSSSSVENVKSKGGSFTEGTPSIVSVVEDNLDPLAMYTVPTVSVPEKDVEALADALYTDRGGAVAYQVNNFDDMHSFAKHIANSEAAGDGNVLGVFENRDLYEAAQAAAYNTAHVPADLMKIGGQSQFQPTNLTADQVRDVVSCGFNVVENKADMFMMSTGHAVGGSYLDHFVDVKYIQDKLTFATQRFMNEHEMPYNQATIDALKLSVQSEANNLYKQGLFINYKPVVAAVSRADTSSSDVGSRVYRGISVHGDLFNSIEKFNGSIQLDE